MRAPIALVLVLALCSCTTRQKVAGGGLGLAVVGLGLTFSTEARSTDEVGTKGTVGITLLLTGLATLFVAAALEESANKEGPKEIRVSHTPTGPTAEQRAAQQRATEAQRKRDQAWALTREAQEAARANNCPRVTELSAQVGALDRDFFADVFMKDVAVQNCFVPQTEPSPEPSAPAVLPTP